MKIFFLFIQIIFILPVFSQNTNKKQVDSLLSLSYSKFADFQFTESLRLAHEASHLSSSDLYSEGIVKSNLYIAKVLVETGMDKNALNYLMDNHDEPYYKTDIVSQIETVRLKGRIYGNLDFNELALQQFRKQLALSDKLTDEKKRNLSKLWAYQNLEYIYVTLEKTDSIDKYLLLQKNQLNIFEENEVFNELSTLYANKAGTLIRKGDYIAANDFLIKSIQLLDKYKSPYRYYTLEIFGDLEAAKGNHEKAIEYYREALQNSLDLNVTQVSARLYKILADYYVKLNKYPDLTKEYLKKYRILNDSLVEHNKQVVDVITKQILEDNNTHNTLNLRSIMRIVLIIVLVLFAVALYFFFRYLKFRHKLNKKETILTSKEEEIGALEEKMKKNTFNEIIELAKSNSPEFLILFSQNNQKFMESIKALDPTIKSSELYFCALAYLNFSTKDIANYTFVTTRAVQIRKNRLRKKFNIPSDVDFNEWFRKLDD